MVELDGVPRVPAIADAPRRGELVSVQYLRAVASLFVVAWHAGGEVGLQPWNGFQGGIELFFLISGFVIWTISIDRPPTPGLFLKRRLARIVPFYWAVTTAVVAVLLLRPGLLQTIRLAPLHVLASYLFLPWPNPTPGVGLRPLVIPGWTLNYEMFFYLLFAASLTLPARWRAASLIGALLLCPLAGMLIGGRPDALGFYTSPLLAEMALGVALAVVLGRRNPPLPLAWGLLAAGAVLFAIGAAVWDGHGPGRLILLCLPAAMGLAGAVALDRAGWLPTWAAPKALGDASYALYLIHPLMLSAMAQLWKHTAAHALPGLVFVGASLVATGVAGVVVHVLIEKPLTQALQYRLRLSKTPPSLPAPFARVLTRMLKNPLWVVQN